MRFLWLKASCFLEFVLPAPWTPPIIRSDRPEHKGNTASYPETAYALAQVLWLPADIHKEKESSLDVVLKMSVQHNMVSYLYRIVLSHFIISHDPHLSAQSMHKMMVAVET